MDARRPPARRPLTPRQRDVLDAIRAAIDADGIPPTLREIGQRVGLSSSQTVWQHVGALEAKGYLRRGVRRSGARTLQLCDSPIAPVAAPRLDRVLVRLRLDVGDTPHAAGPACEAGHPRTPDNRWRVAGLGLCLACGRADMQAYLAAKAGA